jgi:hypothetical protein
MVNIQNSLFEFDYIMKLQIIKIMVIIQCSL